MEPQQREAFLHGLVIITELQQHAFAKRVEDILRVERPPFGLAARRALFQQRFISEEPYALLH